MISVTADANCPVESSDSPNAWRQFDSNSRDTRVEVRSELRLEALSRVYEDERQSSYEGLTVDALASGGDEGRGTLR